MATRLSQEEFAKRYGEDTLNQFGNVRERKNRGFFSTLGDAVTGIAQDVKETFTGAVGQVEEGLETAGDVRERVASGETSPVAGTFQTIGAGLQAGAGVVGEGIVGAGKAVLPQQAEEAIGETVQKGAEKIAQMDITQDTISWYQGLNEETQRNIDATLGVAEGLGTIFGAGQASRFGRAGREAASDVTERSREVAERSKEVFESTLTSGQSAVERITPQTIRMGLLRVPPETREEAVGALANAYESSFLGKKTVLDKVEKLSRMNNMEEEQLLKQFAESGAFPDIQDNLARFSKSIDGFKQEQNQIGEAIDNFLEQVPERTSLSDLESKAKARLNQTAQFAPDIDKTRKELDRLFNNFRNFYGEDVTAKQLNEIRVSMNARTKAFKGEKFDEDTANIIGGSVRDRIDEVVGDPIVRELNKEWGNLQTMTQVARAFNNQKVDVGIINDAAGSWIAASALGTSGIATGSASLVIAGLAAALGQKAFSNFIRRLRFNDTLRNSLKREIENDRTLLDEILERTDKADRERVERLLLPAGATPAGPRGSTQENLGSQVEAVPAPRGEPGRTPKGKSGAGRFFPTFRSGTE